MTFDFFIPTKILFGPGRLNDLGTAALPGKKALIVITSGNSMRKNGYLDRVIALLKQNNAGSAVYDKVSPNPTLTQVTEGAALANAENCDFVIGLGGGSAIDAAKAMAVKATNPGDYWDYVSGGSGKSKGLVNPPLPIIAITTTAGTGTEADPWSVVTKEETHEKIGNGFIPGTFPVLSIVDPELMTTVPPKLTAFQGFDALFHSVEGYIANIATPISDALALKAIELVARYLPTAVKDGNNIEARNNVAVANTLSGMVESTSCCTSQHSLAHTLGAFNPEMPHGAALITLCISYFAFFQDKVPERIVDMARAMGMAHASKPSDFVDCLKKLIKDCGVEDVKMSDYGVNPNDFPEYVLNAKDTMGNLFALDRYQVSNEETLEILQNAYR